MVVIVCALVLLMIYSSGDGGDGACFCSGGGRCHGCSGDVAVVEVVVIVTLAVMKNDLRPYHHYN